MKRALEGDTNKLIEYWKLIHDGTPCCVNRMAKLCGKMGKQDNHHKSGKCEQFVTNLVKLKIDNGLERCLESQSHGRVD